MFEGTQNWVSLKILDLDLHDVRGDLELGPLENTGSPQTLCRSRSSIFEGTKIWVPSKILDLDLDLDLHKVRGDPELGPLENT